MAINNSIRYNRFNNLIHTNNLIGIGSVGNPFTCHNKNQNEYAICARLDHALPNHLW